jgi:hypothetical protein
VANISDFEHHSRKFLDRISGMPVLETREMSIGQLHTSHEVWKNWQQAPGIYCFIRSGVVQYVGRATASVGLGSRVFNQINAFGDPRWDVVIKDDATVCKVIVFPDDDWFWLAALELYLIEKLGKPSFNKKAG